MTSMSDLPPDPRLTEVYERLAREVRDTIAHAASQQRWLELGAWLDDMVIAHTPPQDAPALGYHVPQWVSGAVAWTGAVPPVIRQLPDPIADLVKAYRLIRDHPEYP